jgi:D-alanine-D-alanine ligase
MTRIGFVYNQKPDQTALRLEEEDSSLSDDEPPSTEPDDEFAEWDSPETIAAVEHALSALGEVIRLEANAEFPEQLRAVRPDIVFNIAEGLRGANRESHVPAICEFFGVPYSGSDPFTLSLCLDKARTKECLAYHGVPTAPFTVVRDVESWTRNRPGRNAFSSLTISGTSSRTTPELGNHGVGSLALSFPLFAKPVHEGSSKGITERCYCRTTEELESQVAFLLERYHQPVLVEEFLPGAEFTCAILGNGETARVLPIVGMRYDALPAGALPLYGFEAKWLWDRREDPLEIFECPASVDESLRRDIEKTALAAYRVLGCRDWSRVDVRLDAAGVPNVVEVNPLPGIIPDPADNSCLPKAARAAGMSYDDLIQACMLHASERQGVALSKTLTRGVRGTHRRAAMGGS